MSKVSYGISRKGLVKGLDTSPIDEIGRPINYSKKMYECNTKI